MSSLGCEQLGGRKDEGRREEGQEKGRRERRQRRKEEGKKEEGEGRREGRREEGTVVDIFCTQCQHFTWTRGSITISLRLTWKKALPCSWV